MARNMTRANPRSDLVRAGAGGGAFPGIEDFFRDLSLAPALRALEQAPRGPLHEVPDLHQNESRDRNQHQEHEGQLPTDPASDEHAHDGLERFRHHFAEKGLDTGAQGLHVIGETGH